MVAAAGAVAGAGAGAGEDVDAAAAGVVAVAAAAISRHRVKFVNKRYYAARRRLSRGRYIQYKLISGGRLRAVPFVRRHAARVAATSGLQTRRGDSYARSPAARRIRFTIGQSTRQARQDTTMAEPK